MKEIALSPTRTSGWLNSVHCVLLGHVLLSGLTPGATRGGSRCCVASVSRDLFNSPFLYELRRAESLMDSRVMLIISVY